MPSEEEAFDAREKEYVARLTGIVESLNDQDKRAAERARHRDPSREESALAEERAKVEGLTLLCAQKDGDKQAVLDDLEIERTQHEITRDMLRAAREEVAHHRDELQRAAGTIREQAEVIRTLRNEVDARTRSLPSRWGRRAGEAVLAGLERLRDRLGG